MKLWLFVGSSLAIILFSWSSIRNRTHGFPRFFAVELVLILILINAGHWFNEPFSVLHVFSWLALLASLLLAIHGFYLLRVIGRPQGSFEDTTKLVTLGAYKYIRHPLYCSLLLGAWGAFLKDVSPLSIGLVIAASAFLVATAKVEETENLKRFAQEYADYRKETKMFIPFLY
jgi:protein-S-isoprenylcysteine O-methyltransferase Ste14